MAYCEVDDIVRLTGTDLSEDKIAAIIDSAGREVDAYLDKYGLTGTATGAVMEATIKLSVAGVYSLGGNLATQETLWTAIKELRKNAFDLLSMYVAAADSPYVKVTRLRVIRGT